MDGLTQPPGYSHSQKASLCLVLYGSALSRIALALVIAESPGT